MEDHSKPKRRKLDSRTHQTGYEETTNTPAFGFLLTPDQGNDQLQDKVEDVEMITEACEIISSQRDKQTEDKNTSVVENKIDIRFENITDVVTGELVDTPERTQYDRLGEIKTRVSSLDSLDSEEKVSIKYSTNEHQAQLETNANLLTAALADAGDREIQRLDEHQAKIETNSNLFATAIQDAGEREIQRINKDVETHKRDIDALATRKKAEITQHQQQQQQAADIAFRADPTNKHQSQIEANTNLCLTAIEGAGDREIERMHENAETHKRDIDLLALRTKIEISQQQQQVDKAFRTELKNILIEHHLKSNSSLFLGPFFSDSRLKDVYVPPRLSEVLNIISREKNRPTEKETRPITSLEQILTPDDTTNQFTIITANAGVGKSSFCKFLSVLWCALHDQKTDTISKFTESFDIHFDSLKDIPYVLYIPLRDIPPGRTPSIEEIIFAHLENMIGYQKEDREKLERVFMDERCLVILDGMDESSLSTLNSPKAKRKYSILITCRPWKLADMELPKYMHVCIDDLNKIAQKKLFKHVNTILNTFYGTTFNVEDFFATLETQKLQSLSSNTQVGLQLYCLWQDRNMENEKSEKSKKRVTLGPTRSHIYADVLEMMFNPKKTEDKKTQNVHKYPLSNKGLFLHVLMEGSCVKQNRI